MQHKLGIVMLMTYWLLTGCGSEVNSKVIEDNPLPIEVPVSTEDSATQEPIFKDTTAPKLNMDLNSSDTNVSKTTYKILKASVSDDVDVASVTLEFNGKSTALPNNNGSLEIPLSLRGGQNDYRIVATDTSGNTSQIDGSIYLGMRTTGGNSHSGALKDGNLYTWGRNNFGQTGLGYTSQLKDENITHPNSPSYVITPVPFVALAFNQNFSLALDAEGNVWSWGDNDDQELGRGDSVDICSLSATQPDCIISIGKIDSLTNIVMISAGYSHSLALGNDGTVWAFGTNSDGELGNGIPSASSSPVKVKWDTNESVNIIQVSAGSDYSCALDDGGQVWVWGKNNYGQTGQGVRDTPDQLVPIKVPFPEGVKIASIATGSGHILAMDDNGTVYGWGLSASNQIADKDVERYVLTPTVIMQTVDHPATAIYANGNTSYLMRDGALYVWGLYGETTSEAKQEYINPKEPTLKIILPTMIDLGIGALHQVGLAENGDVYTWGWSFEGSLGGGDETINQWHYTNPPILPIFP